MKFKALLQRQVRTEEEKKVLRKELIFGLTSGILLGLSYPPIPLPFLAFIALVPYFYVIEKRDGLGSVNRFTYFTMFFFNLITLYWVGSWTPEADPFLKLSGVALVFFNPLLFLIPSSLYYVARQYISKRYALFFFPAFWVFYEYIYGITEFRFPWLTFGNSQAYFLKFIQIADIVGVFGISMLLLFINVLLYKSAAGIINKDRAAIRFAFGAISIFTLIMIYGFAQDSEKLNSGEKLKVGIIQPDLNPWNKWETGGLDDQIDTYLQMSRDAVQQGAELVIWPETALPVYLMGGSYPTRVMRIWKFVNDNGVPILTGMPDATIFRKGDKVPDEAKSTQSGYKYVSYNSILFFAPGEDEVQKYQKMLLVPFGEKTPYVEYFPLIENLIKWNVGISAWNTGEEIRNFTAKSGSEALTIGGVICIESIYPLFVSQFVEKGAEFIAVVTNDSWYGDSSGPYQHKAIGVLRAVENRRTVVRCANGGISCVILPDGSTKSETGMFTSDILVDEIVLCNEKSFYTQNAMLIPGISLTIVIMLMIVFIANKYFNMKIKFGN